MAVRTRVFRVLPLAALLSTLVVPVVGVLPASACTGGRLFLEGDAESEARAIFTGTVVRRDDASFRIFQPTFPSYYWTLAVDGVEKGDVGETITVASPDSASACAMDFELGARYRVMAYDGADPTWLEVISGDAAPIAPLADPPDLKGAHGIAWPVAAFRLATDPLTFVLLVAFVAAVVAVAWPRLKESRRQPN